MFNWAVGCEYLERTPFRRGTETLVRKLRDDNQRRRRISEDEEQRLLAASPAHLRSLMIVALDTGTRRGEMLALRFKDIDFDSGLITLRGETTKSRKTRAVPISTARLRAVLEWLKLDADGDTKHAESLAFTDDTGAPIGRFRTTWVTTVLKAHGITPKWRSYGWTALTPDCLEEFRRIDLRWHDLRHEYASRLVEKGVPLAQVRDLLGHASITTTERYDNQKLENLQLAAARLERGLTFDRISERITPLSNRQDFVKIGTPIEAAETLDQDAIDEAKLLEESDLENWLGGRDSTPFSMCRRHIEMPLNRPRSQRTSLKSE